MVLGGVRIPHTRGPVGHSDADALLHAICDALLGAAGVGDMGVHFPPTPENRNISSLKLLEQVASHLRKRSLKVQYIDSVVVLERPRLGPYRARMVRSIASELGITHRKVCVKAKTHDGLGLLGGEQAVAAFAIASLARRRPIRKKGSRRG